MCVCVFLKRPALLTSNLSDELEEEPQRHEAFRNISLRVAFGFAVVLILFVLATRR